MRYKLTSNQLVHLEALIALIIGISLRFIYLDADPHYEQKHEKRNNKWS